MNSPAAQRVRHGIRPSRQRILKPFALGRIVVTDFDLMKLIVKKKINPAFKRPQALPVLADVPARLAGLKNYAVAPAVVIVPPQSEPAPAPKSF